MRLGKIRVPFSRRARGILSCGDFDSFFLPHLFRRPASGGGSPISNRDCRPGLTLSSFARYSSGERPSPPPLAENQTKPTPINVSVGVGEKFRRAGNRTLKL